MEQYWLDRFVRHVRGIDDGVGVASDVVTDYRWVRRVAERRSPAGVARCIEQLLSAADEADMERLHDALSRSGAARGVSRDLSAINEQDVRELVKVVHAFRSEIPLEAAKPQQKLGKAGAPSTHDWSVRDRGLAHRIVGRLMVSCGGGSAVAAASARSLEAGRIGVIMCSWRARGSTCVDRGCAQSIRALPGSTATGLITLYDSRVWSAGVLAWREGLCRAWLRE
jgi:hypothetical protein